MIMISEQLNERLVDISTKRDELNKLLYLVRKDVVNELTEKFINKHIPIIDCDTEEDNGVFVSLTNKHGEAYQYSYLLGVTNINEYNEPLLLANIEGDIKMCYIDEVGTNDLIELLESMVEFNINELLIEYKQ